MIVIVQLMLSLWIWGKVLAAFYVAVVYHPVIWFLFKLFKWFLIDFFISYYTGVSKSDGDGHHEVHLSLCPRPLCVLLW